MTPIRHNHITVREWGKVAITTERNEGISRAEANALLVTARNHLLGGDDGSAILTDHHRWLSAKQMVGVIAAPQCSLEILPKIDRADDHRVRHRLIHMLNVALDLNISVGEATSLSRQKETLLDILIRLFVDRLIAETRRGLPRNYIEQEDDLPILRGRLDIVRQFTTNAPHPNRIACRFDSLSSDIPLLQIMKCCVISLARFARTSETQRKLWELRLVLADVADVSPSSLPWHLVQINRNSQRWSTLYALAKLFLKRDWQSSNHQTGQAEGVTLLFPMNTLFESYVTASLRKALAPLGLRVVAQGGLRPCLGDWSDDGEIAGNLFATKPDIMVKRGTRTVAIIDTKWKQIEWNALDRKNGVSQADVYQMMAYAQLYQCDRLILLYPHAGSAPHGLVKAHGIAVPGRRDRLAIATVDIGCEQKAIEAALRAIIIGEIAEVA
jgi:5-methylcytosine-specific restriction enzyme subunit McrC